MGTKFLHGCILRHNINNINNFIFQWTYIGLYYGEAAWPNSSLRVRNKQASQLHRKNGFMEKKNYI